MSRHSLSIPEGVAPAARRGHRRPAVALTAVLLLVLGGCGWGDADYTPNIGSNARVQGIDVLSAAAVTDGGGVATVVATVINNSEEDNALVGVAARDDTSDITAVLDEPLPLPPGEPVQLSPNSAIALMADELPVGLFIELQLDFRNGPSVDLLIPVEPQEGPYSEIEVEQPADEDISPE